MGAFRRLAIVLAVCLMGCSEDSDGDTSDGGGSGTAGGPAVGPVCDGDWQEVSPAQAELFQQELEEARAEQDLPGLAMAIAYRDTREIWFSSTGLADLAEGTAWKPTDKSRIGSVTKLFTAAIIFQLVDEGVLSLDDPLEQWVPQWYEGVTLRHLLGHTSGIVSYNYVGDFDTTAPWEPEELVQWAFDGEPALQFEPGTQWEYSNTNYVLLGLVIEAATGNAYEDELSTRLFGPLGLEETRLATSGDEDAQIVQSYAGTPPVETWEDPSYGWAAGAGVSTPCDLALWTTALFGGDVLSASSLTAMTTPNDVTTPEQRQYGLGAFYESDGQFEIVGHTGGIAGYQSYAYYLEDPAVTLVVLSNWKGTDLDAAATYGWAAILGIEYP